MGVANTLRSVGRYLFGVEKGQQTTRYPIDEDRITNEEVIKAQQKQIQARNAQLARISAEEKEQSEKEKEKDYTQQIAQRVKEKTEEIRKRRYNNTFSLRYFFNMMGYQKRPTKFGKSVDLTDKDDKVVFGKLGDIIVSDNGDISVTDENDETLIYGSNFSQVIWKPDGLFNYMRRNRLPLAMDEKMNSIPDLEEEEHHDILYDENEEKEEDRNKQTRVRQRKVKDMIIERDERLRELQKYTERIEKMKIDLEHDLQTETRTRRILENRESLGKAQLSEVIAKQMEYENKFLNLQNQNIKLTQLKALYETMSERYKSINESLLNRLESHGDKTMHQKVKDEIKDDIEFYGGQLPEKVIVKEVEKETVKSLAEPGQQLQQGASR